MAVPDEFSALCISRKDNSFESFPPIYIHRSLGNGVRPQSMTEIPYRIPFRKVLADAPRHQKAERGYLQMCPGTKEMFPGTKNRNEGTFAKTALLRNRPFVSSRVLKRVLLGFASPCGFRGSILNFRIGSVSSIRGLIAATLFAATQKSISRKKDLQRFSGQVRAIAGQTPRSKPKCPEKEPEWGLGASAKEKGPLTPSSIHLNSSVFGQELGPRLRGQT